MNPEPKVQGVSEVSDFADVLLPPDGSEPPVIVGGHAVNLWSLYFLTSGVNALAEFLPFISKDLDLVGTTDLLERLHLRFKGELTRSEPRSPVLGRLEIPSRTGGCLRVEVLHTVKGLDFKEINRTIDLMTGSVFGRVLLPQLVLKAKIENSATIDQVNRNDVKHVAMMILCVRSFIADLLVGIARDGISERTVVNLLSEVWEIVSSQQATIASKLWGFDFSTVWPMENLKASNGEKILRWLEHRFP